MRPTSMVRCLSMGKDMDGKMKSLCLFFTLFISFSCANRGFNQATTGSIHFRGGVYKTQVWDDSLIFGRASWYHGMTLYYDALIYNADKDSLFAQWFSESEKEYFHKCEKFIVTVNYSADATKISHVMFREQMRINGYDDVVVNSFASAVKTHPNYQAWNLQHYKILGYCKRLPTKFENENTVVINFPSFRELNIKLKR